MKNWNSTPVIVYIAPSASMAEWVRWQSTSPVEYRYRDLSNPPTMTFEEPSR